MTQTWKTLQFEMDAQGIAVCTFNRPDQRNALNLEMVGEIRSLLEELTLAGKTRVLIFRGAGGKSFISGADIAELRERRSADALARINSSLFAQIEAFPMPTIAAIRGYALGGGCELALACDLRICGEGAQLGQPEVSLGIIPGAGATYRLPRLVGLGKARELIFTGKIIGAPEALDIGLVNRVVADGDVMDASRALAQEIAAQSPLALRMAKSLLNNAGSLGTEAALAWESAAQATLFDDDEKFRRMDAFLQRKAARK
jgi:enoyl-CoA hydratase